jgi:hypothetical protein
VERLIGSVAAPVLVVHSREDEIIPFRHGEALYAAATAPKQMLELQGDHNTGFLRDRQAYIEGIDAFLRDWDSVGAAPSGSNVPNGTLQPALHSIPSAQAKKVQLGEFLHQHPARLGPAGGVPGPRLDPQHHGVGRSLGRAAARRRTCSCARAPRGRRRSPCGSASPDSRCRDACCAPANRRTGHGSPTRSRTGRSRPTRRARSRSACGSAACRARPRPARRPRTGPVAAIAPHRPAGRRCCGRRSPACRRGPALAISHSAAAMKSSKYVLLALAGAGRMPLRPVLAAAAQVGHRQHPADVQPAEQPQVPLRQHRG